MDNSAHVILSHHRQCRQGCCEDCTGVSTVCTQKHINRHHTAPAAVHVLATPPHCSSTRRRWSWCNSRLHTVAPCSSGTVARRPPERPMRRRALYCIGIAAAGVSCRGNGADVRDAATGGGRLSGGAGDFKFGVYKIGSRPATVTVGNAETRACIARPHRLRSISVV